VRVAYADGKPATIHAGVEFNDPEHLHAVFGDGVLLGNDADVPEAQGFDQGLDDFGVKDGPVSGRAQWCGNGGQLLTRQLFS
jgi:hypothetical protein